ncbi:MAG: hypothetical protein GXO92_04810 [FCB group bacterium]|nr:hypothetical protein [FCB group bacterium]
MNITRHITKHFPKQALIVPILLSIAVWAPLMAQQQPKLYGQFEGQMEETPTITTTEKDLRSEVVPLENVIDPETYILSAGDQLGIDVVASENLLFTVTVNPAGDVLIPSVGIINVAGNSLTQARLLIHDGITTHYRNAQVSVTLVNVRRFLVQVKGAVQKPGFATVTPLDRLSTVLESVEGLHKYADEEKVTVEHPDGTKTTVSLKAYLLTGDLTQNPTVREGDIIDVPFVQNYEAEQDQFVTMKETAVTVTGFVPYPGAYRYFPGYSVIDYIGLAGGILETGTDRNVRIKRNGTTRSLHEIEYVLPGDQIYVPENLQSRLFGNVGIVRTVTAVASLYLTYVAATRKK